MQNSSLCDFNDAYILLSGTITVVGVGADDAARAADRNNKHYTKNHISQVLEYHEKFKKTK